ncbi:MAG: helix-turn-helix domain-containing protein, partial [Gemmatimonadales bacterium]
GPAGAPPAGPVTNLRDAVEASERQTIAAALDAARGNRREAARRLGVSVRTLFYKMERYRLE